MKPKGVELNRKMNAYILLFFFFSFVHFRILQFFLSIIKVSRCFHYYHSNICIFFSYTSIIHIHIHMYIKKKKIKKNIEHNILKKKKKMRLLLDINFFFYHLEFVIINYGFICVRSKQLQAYLHCNEDDNVVLFILECKGFFLFFFSYLFYIHIMYMSGICVSDEVELKARRPFM